MATIQISFSDKEEEIINMYKAKHHLKSKKEAVKRIVKEYSNSTAYLSKEERIRRLREITIPYGRKNTSAANEEDWYKQ